MKNKIPAIFLKEILVLFVEMLVIVSPSYYAFSKPNSEGEGTILMLFNQCFSRWLLRATSR